MLCSMWRPIELPVWEWNITTSLQKVDSQSIVSPREQSQRAWHEHASEYDDLEWCRRSSPSLSLQTHQNWVGRLRPNHTRRPCLEHLDQSMCTQICQEPLKALSVRCLHRFCRKLDKLLSTQDRRPVIESFRPSLQRIHQTQLLHFHLHRTSLVSHLSLLYSFSHRNSGTKSLALLHQLSRHHQRQRGQRPPTVRSSITESIWNLSLPKWVDLSCSIIY